jgi:catechol 2,3-dioxygenase-like lactoylglutathione lyase family enzyme
MQALGVHHVALVVTDLDAALDFYVGKLGAQQLERPDFGFPGAWLQLGAQQVHLGVSDDPVPNFFQHFALQVADVDACVADLQAAGVKVDPIPHMPGAGHQAFLHDPSGNMIELNQPDS